MLPSRIAHYVVLSRLGMGGMGEVFLAQDDKLQRKVAIKRVRPDALDAQASRRLLTEARAIARLDHPHICAIHEIGEDADGPYIVMPFVEGETLSARIARGPLPVDKAVAIAAQVVDGLAAAHARGIVHRDVKPGNIMIDARGQARVMDFGLARVAAAATEASHIETATRLTIAGSTVGTVAYMSPEQARACAVDARSDLFSVGVLLYEMLAGRRPFDGASPADTLSALLTSEPVPLARVRPEVPDALQRIVTKALRKRVDERYQSAEDLLVDLRDAGRAPFDAPTLVAPASAPVSRRGSSRWVWIAVAVVVLAAAVYAGLRFIAGRTPAAGVPVITSIAVLPLDNLSADPSQDYFADGMTEALTTALARIKSLRVLSRTSTLQYRGAKPRMPEIAATLNADALVEGSVLRDGDRVRITAQLIHGPTDSHLWADSYDGDVRDVLGLQRRVAEAIAREVRATVVPDDAAAASPKRPINVRAQDLYLRGRYQFYMFTSMSIRDTLADAITLYEEALEIDPTFAEAWAALAQARHWMAHLDTTWASGFDASREAALRALAIDDSVADAHGALAYVSSAYDWDFATAEREYARAIGLDPSTEYQHGYAMMLSVLGRHDEARWMFEEAKARDPLNLALRINSGVARLRSREYAEAIAEARAVEARAPDAYYLIAWAQLWQGHGTDALADLERLAAAGSIEPSFEYAALLSCAGRTAEARTRLGQLKITPPSHAKSGVAAGSAMHEATTYICAGDRDRALATLEQAAAMRVPWLPEVATDRAFEPLKTDPRFQALMRRFGLASR